MRWVVGAASCVSLGAAGLVPLPRDSQPPGADSGGVLDMSLYDLVFFCVFASGPDAKRAQSLSRPNRVLRLCWSRQRLRGRASMSNREWQSPFPLFFLFLFLKAPAYAAVTQVRNAPARAARARTTARSSARARSGAAWARRNWVGFGLVQACGARSALFPQADSGLWAR